MKNTKKQRTKRQQQQQNNNKQQQQQQQQQQKITKNKTVAMNLPQAVRVFTSTQFDGPYSHIWSYTWPFDSKWDQILTK